MPAKLAQRIKKARNFNQGFSTVEYVASALVDMELHALPEVEGLDVDTFERTTQPITYTFRVAVPPDGVGGYDYDIHAEEPAA